MPPTDHPSLRAIREEHATLAAVLRALLHLADEGPGDRPEGYFDTLRAMLFYIDEFPERQHHPKESDLLFPRIARLAPDTMEVIGQLEREHIDGEAEVRALQHRLLAWELLGEPRRADFVHAARRYVEFYLEHMRLEEVVLLPIACELLGPQDWAVLDAAFAAQVDPLGADRDPAYDRLFTRIAQRAPKALAAGVQAGLAWRTPAAEAASAGSMKP
ncbi:hemerythrin domain-containing protein [Xylophilus sp.]|uniref:hemerythrin domain-containing protein n=1 Tax=Xylophilus sp. TaxID=2653893 RepID=UPI0013B919EC|nr:hemerythrin domain-containing protein [Xylophilus sp.]KAF1050161.1 MAG: hypothetical protein GAK38_00187 [Xylophilus sp.]